MSIKWRCPDCGKERTCDEGHESADAGHYRPNTHGYTKDICYGKMTLIVDTEKYRKYIAGFSELWPERVVQTEPFGVRGRDLLKLLDVYEAAQKFATAETKEETDDRMYDLLKVLG